MRHHEGTQHIVSSSSSSSVSHSVVSNSLQPHKLEPTRLLCPGDSPGKNTGVDCHSLLQRIFLTQGSNPGLLHGRQILYHLSYREDPYIVRPTVNVSIEFYSCRPLFQPFCFIKEDTGAQRGEV